jgi:hypothetical protein
MSRVRALLARHRAFGKWQAAAPGSANSAPRIAGFAPRTLAFPSAPAHPAAEPGSGIPDDDSTDFRAKVRAALRRQDILASDSLQSIGSGGPGAVNAPQLNVPLKAA